VKRVLKSAEPALLAGFKKAKPEATWDDMRHDPMHNGRRAARDCLTQAADDQKGLCAYCETKIDPEAPHRCRVEHFHPKSDSSPGRNWHLDWQNMLATCNGGETDKTPDAPLPDNLSCDAHKNHLANQGALPPAVEGDLINPLDIPAFPNVFTLHKGTGRLMPDASACAQAGVSEIQLSRTIEVLNLNCERLARQRRQIVRDVDQNKKTLRQLSRRPDEAGDLLARRYFGELWPAFFTTIRCCLGLAAEIYLQSVQYQG
jgi:uncharacterized protein (TIGR02646 family)